MHSVTGNGDALKYHILVSNVLKIFGGHLFAFTNKSKIVPAGPLQWKQRLHLSMRKAILSHGCDLSNGEYLTTQEQRAEGGRRK